jgi:hypothetical protein
MEEVDRRDLETLLSQNIPSIAGHHPFASRNIVPGWHQSQASQSWLEQRLSPSRSGWGSLDAIALVVRRGNLPNTSRRGRIDTYSTHFDAPLSSYFSGEMVRVHRKL